MHDPAMIEATSQLASATMEVPVGWVITSIGGLGGIIATLANSLYQTLKSSITALTARVAAQDEIIQTLQGEIDMMSNGCGVEECTWRKYR